MNFEISGVELFNTNLGNKCPLTYHFLFFFFLPLFTISHSCEETQLDRKVAFAIT